MDRQQGQRILAAGATLAIAEPALAHFGGPGVIVGLAAGAAAYLTADHIQKARNGDSSPVDQQKKPDEQRSLAYRLFNGKSVRESGQEPCVTHLQTEQLPVTQGLPEMEELQPKPKQAERQGDDLGSLEEMIQQSDNTLPGHCLFSTMLRTFTPTEDRVFLGYLPGGKAVFVSLEKLCHVALAGLTGNGKTTLIRLIVSQLEYVGAKVLILNPHYTSYDIKKHEDWTPIERHLYRLPMTDFASIGSTMKWAATVLLRDRLEKYRQSIPWGSPIFLVIDELPAIVKHVPEFPEYVSEILREGRKVDIFLIVASQDFLTKTIGPDEGGAVRKNYKTKMYVGGDVTTANVLLDPPPRQKIPEDQLGEGVIMMRNQVVTTASLARVPFVDNEALYMLLGPSTYKAAKQCPDDEEDLMSYMVSGDDYEDENAYREKRTDELHASHTTRLYASGMRLAERKQERAQRLRSVPVHAQERQAGGIQGSEMGQVVTETAARDDTVEISVQDAFAVWSAGNSNVRDLAKAMGITVYKATQLYGAMVEAGLIQRKAKVVVNKD